MEKSDKRTKEIINEMLRNMSVREKIGQCIMVEPVFCLEDLNKNHNYNFTSIVDPNFLDLLFNKYHIGLFLFGGITRLGDSKMNDWGKHLDLINQYAKSVHHIPLLFGVDAVHGVNFVQETTIFPHNLSVASTWNKNLTRDYANNVSKELRSIGFNLNFAPTIDVARDPRWGRVYESLGEDAYLASKITESLVGGLQMDNNVAACAKHFVGYGESRNGMDRTPADISERALREHHLPPFEQAIKSGVKTIMVNGGDFNGVPVPASKYLLTTLLRDELEFEGVTLSDWEDVHRLVDRHFVVENQEQAILRAFNAGLDMNMAVSNLETIDIMEKLVEEGKITLERLNQAVFRILKTKFGLGLFDQNNIDFDEIEMRPYRNESEDIAYEIAKESFVLLKNEGNILPLKSTIRSVIVVGDKATSKRHMCGGWTLNWASADEEDLNFLTIYEQLLKEYPSIDFTLVESLEELKKVDVNQYDFMLNVVGEEPHSEWLGDSFDMKMEKEEEELLVESLKYDIKNIVISMIGRPVKLNYLVEKMDALLWCYYPGTSGAKAIVDMLFGKVSPSGKLPISFPKDPNQIPCVYNARRYYSNEIKTSYDPLFEFGYGLSYTTFSYENLIVQKGKDGVSVSVDIKNTGRVDGNEVVQVYIRDVYASVTRPLKSLKGFEKVFLKSKEEKTVTIVLSNDDLSLYDEFYNFVYEEREIDILISSLVKRIKIG